MSRLKKLIQQFGLLSRIDQAFLISLVVRVGYPLVGSVYQLPGEGFVRLIFVITSILFLIRSFPKLVRKVLWRVRHRLLATWLLVGVVPIVLICALLWEGLFILMGQVVGYMTTNEITRQSESVRSTAYGLAWSLAHRESSATIPTLTETFVKETAEARHAEIGAIVRIGTETIAVPHEGAIRDIPQWSQPDFSGLVKDKGRYYFGAHIGLDGSAGKTEVFVYQYARADFFNNLLPKVATILMGPGLARAGGIDIQYDRVAEDLTS